ncbi:hypothetical protein KAFR_0J02460 [Kazachstania africana CBS 2517]|uniref:KOW domain-containing protein n=1 Tax=Kazachstania africana (strain ATCC 22294 / BCRC 22015 / CBS 2517 / CECT 1963 / NBRC 1671 / NRRL Y-8276) TaxID=1071382 RepID=H2B110_KAZAF|nr:hypothetical protein KAFR_0J02460 [Kazachstania africana CBS 2517]CCF60310.1 hypothetical protein KAFR_0J02460 [Kazachstania africana CBS 2517]
MLSVVGIGRRCFQTVSKGKKMIPVYPGFERTVKNRNALLSQVSKEDVVSKLDPQGWRRKLLHPEEASKGNSTMLKVGDVVKIIYDKNKCSNENFVGYILSVDKKVNIQDSSLLLRNQISNTFVELRVPIFSPLVERIDVLRKTDGLKKRNKHYYIRGTKLDVGNLETKLRKQQQRHHI